jgi:predicted metalloprotease with PDZ domain
MRPHALLVSSVLLLTGGLARAQSPLAVRYEVSIASLGGRLLRAAATFPTGGMDTLRVSLPAWSPGSYEIQNYARYVRHFGARGQDGTSLWWDRLDKDTWRVATAGAASVTVEFDLLADTIDLSLARVTADFAVVLGTNLFLFEEGKLDRPAEVRFRVPEGWDVMTALRPSGAGVYAAPDYHELADAMTFLGRFSRDSLLVDSAWVRIGVWPASAYTPAVARNLRRSLERLTAAQNRLMGGPPYDVYTVFFAAVPDPIDFGGGLEHSYSHFNILPAPAFADEAGNLGGFVNPLVSHELFHLWNVKRIRPAELWPYDYTREQYTPLLWWSEGVTDYYADVSNLRAGLWTEGDFVQNVQNNIDQVDQAPEPWSAEDGSAATWIDEVFVNSSQLYYPKGSVLGLLLDISIRDATNGARSLDDVTRALYTRFATRGRGFTTADLLALLRETGMPDVDGFYRRYVDGREPLPYEAVLPKAGFAVERRSFAVPFVGVSTAVQPGGGTRVDAVTPGSSAEAAGVLPGDELLEVGGIAVTATGDWAAAFRARYAGKAGQPLEIVVRRNGGRVVLRATVRERTGSRMTVARAATPTARQNRVWRGIATGSTVP